MPQEISSFFRKLLDLREGAEEKNVIIENIKDDADFSSARFWTLVFAIGAASVGLNINSIPVVIGAMLISPLMGPIVSIGLSLAIYDWGLMRRSFRNLLTLTIISIGISAIYFALTPITNAQSELLSRIQPTIFDVLIAIFGGMAGFIGISRARQNNVIPGVAIATALMPPLCTVGYGIGTMQPKFIFGAFFLFLINSIFICLSALVVAKYLKLPKRDYPDEEHKKKVRRIISIVIISIVTPAIFLSITFIDQNKFNNNVERYLKVVFEDRGHHVDYKKLSYKPTSQEVELTFLSEQFTSEQIAEFEARLVEFDLKDVKLSFRQNGFTLTKEEWESIINDMKTEGSKVEALEARLESEKLQHNNPAQLLVEAQAINPKVVNIATGPLSYGGSTSEGGQSHLAIFVYTDSETGLLTKEEAEVISKWLGQRVKDSLVTSYFIPAPVVSVETLEF